MSPMPLQSMELRAPGYTPRVRLPRRRRRRPARRLRRRSGRSANARSGKRRQRPRGGRRPAGQLAAGESERAAARSSWWHISVLSAFYNQPRNWLGHCMAFVRLTGNAALRLPHQPSPLRMPGRMFLQFGVPDRPMPTSAVLPGSPTPTPTAPSWPPRPTP